MTKTRSTKRALLMSVLALLMCMSMLVGSTMAWFTDSVTSTGNKIQAGTLKLDLKLFDGTDYKSIKESKKAIFDYDKWEPGYTDVKLLKIENNGTLALKWYAKFVSANELTVLADVIDVYVYPSETELSMPADRDLTGYTKVGTVREFINTIETTTKGTLEGGKFAYLGIALKMQETAGNDYQGLTIGAFDIQILATQATVEEDSFNDQYDANAPVVWSGKTNVDWYLANPAASEFELSTAEELAGLAAIVNGTAEDIAQDTFSGQTIKLTSDIDLGNVAWTTIGKNHDVEGADPFCGTFDGQGHTVYNLNIHIEDNQRDSVGFIGYAKDAKIKGLTIENVNINADYFVGAVVGKLSVGEISDCHVKGDIKIEARRNYAAGIVGDGYYDMKNCSVVSDGQGTIKSKAVAGGLCGRINEGTHCIENCTVKNLDIQSGQQIAAITGFVHYGNTISGCNVENVKLTLTAATAMKPAIGLASGLWYYKDGALITISDNVFKNITISAMNDVTGTTNILYGWEWNDATTGVVDVNNTTENINNTLNYQ